MIETIAILQRKVRSFLPNAVVGDAGVSPASPTTKTRRTTSELNLTKARFCRSFLQKAAVATRYSLLKARFV
ncbi:MAG: hypothetical protein HC939_23990 [Pleurocapsa sp. SU_5_0]|nr:hypothetical protein [Pleurocapsa sp. SU_5_0]